MEKDQREREVIEHLSHPHPLVLNGDQSNQTKEAHCRGCLEPLFEPCFSCGECNCQFHLHKRCAQAPSQITNSPFHRKHPILDLKSEINRWCDLCEESRDMFSYWCNDCGCCLDIKCAFLLHNIDENFRELKYVAHKHPLSFVENPNDELKTAHCYWCQKPLASSVYVCLDCRFYLHKKCAQLSSQLSHPCHREHPLYPEIGEFHCNICQKDRFRLFYRCLPCKFGIDIECLLSSLVIEDKSHHEHPFNLFCRPDPFICDGCGTEGNFASYICFICHLQVHAKCISLPHVIKTTRHNHPIFHKYFGQKTELETQDCRICYEEVKTRYGCYYCLKHDCNYIVHVNCAIQYDRLYRTIGPENLDKTGDSSDFMESSITRILEKNERGDAIKIEHFSHQHYLMVGDNIYGDDDDDDKHCDGCMRSMISSGSFYSCSECDFLLHKKCAELPRKFNHSLHPHLFFLKSNGIFRCNRCYHQCSGLFYKCDECDITLCLKCSDISDSFMYPGHEHLLFFDPKYDGQCTACGATIYYAFRCTKKCNYALHLECIILPHAVQHKCDKHFLKLCYHEKGDPEQCICDICEEQRDPKHWFYHCSICDKSAHPKCALGEYPFIKVGRMYIYEEHPHPLTFVRKMYNYPQPCFKCGQHCQDLSLECATCNYIVHWECIPRRKRLQYY